MATIGIDLQHLHTQQKKRELIQLAKQTGNVHMLPYMFYKIMDFGIKLNRPFNTKDDVIEHMHKALVQITPNTPENVLANFKIVMNNWKEYKHKNVTY